MTGAPTQRDTRRVILSSYVGSAIEFYDFLLYTAAASVVFSQVFFADTSGAVGTILSFSTLAVGYLIRPLGGIIFGHFGDRLGRKRMLITTMTMMGVATVLIGLLPDYGTIGVAAPILLVVLRLIQGIAVGGDWGGSASISVETAKQGRRGFTAAFVNMSASTGATLASAVLGLFSMMEDDDFLTWGWRIPFLLSAVLVVIGLVIRLRMQESPQFVELQEQAEDDKKKKTLPLVEVLRDRWRAVLTAVFGTVAAFVLQGLMASYAITLATDDGGHTRSNALLAYSVASVVQIFAVSYFGHLSDRIGRNRVILIGLGVGLFASYPVLWLVAQPSTATLYAGMILGTVTVGTVYGPGAAFISEMFSTQYRYTGSSLGYQLASTLGSGLGPVIAASLAAVGGYHLVGLFIVLSYVLSFAVVAIARPRPTEESLDAPAQVERV